MKNLCQFLEVQFRKSRHASAVVTGPTVGDFEKSVWLWYIMYATHKVLNHGKGIGSSGKGQIHIAFQGRVNAVGLSIEYRQLRGRGEGTKITLGIQLKGGRRVTRNEPSEKLACSKHMKHSVSTVAAQTLRQIHESQKKIFANNLKRTWSANIFVSLYEEKVEKKLMEFQNQQRGHAESNKGNSGKKPTEAEL